MSFRRSGKISKMERDNILLDVERYTLSFYVTGDCHGDLKKYSSSVNTKLFKQGRLYELHEHQLHT